MPKRYYYSRPLTEPEPGQKLDNILDKIRGGEVLEVPSADHVAYDWRGLKAILDRLAARGAIFRPLHTSGRRTNPLEFRFKDDLRRAGVARARASSDDYNVGGRPQTINRELVRKLRDDGITADAIAKRVGASVSGVYAALKSAA